MIGIEDMHVLGPILFLKAEHGRELAFCFTYTCLNLMNKQEAAKKNSEDMSTEISMPFFLLVCHSRLLHKLLRCFLQTSK